MTQGNASYQTSALFTVVLGISAAASAAAYQYLRSQHQRNENKNMNSNGSDLMDIIKRRRSVFPKQYTGEAIQREVIDTMLEAARWAPSHHLTEPWHFIVFSNKESKEKVGEFLAKDYKVTSTATGKFLQKKYEKKLKNTKVSSYIIAICLHRKQGSKCPEVEEICSVAMAVQNMHLIATQYKVGCYWSSASVYDPKHKKTRAVVNSDALREFLHIEKDDATICLGWLFVGDCREDCFKYSTRKPITEKVEFR